MKRVMHLLALTLLLCGFHSSAAAMPNVQSVQGVPRPELSGAQNGNGPTHDTDDHDALDLEKDD